MSIVISKMVRLLAKFVGNWQFMPEDMAWSMLSILDRLKTKVDMFEFHGWLALEWNRDFEGGPPPGFADSMEPFIVAASTREISVRMEHGYARYSWLAMHGVLKRRGTRFEPVERLLAETIRRVPLAHGLVYLRDHESDPEQASVLRIAQGRIDELKDGFLSPASTVGGCL